MGARYSSRPQKGGRGRKPKTTPVVKKSTTTTAAGPKKTKAAKKVAPAKIKAAAAALKGTMVSAAEGIRASSRMSVASEKAKG